MNPELIKIVSDPKVRCLMSVIRGRDVPAFCEKFVPSSLISRFISGEVTEEDYEVVYKLVPQMAEIREKTGIDIVQKLLEVRRRLEGEKVADLASAFVTALSVFGISVGKEDAERLASVVDALTCVKVEGGMMYVDNECLEKAVVPEEFKNQVRMAVAASGFFT